MANNLPQNVVRYGDIPVLFQDKVNYTVSSDSTLNYIQIIIRDPYKDIEYDENKVWHWLVINIQDWFLGIRNNSTFTLKIDSMDIFNTSMYSDDIDYRYI